MMSQITSQGASDLTPNGLTWVLEIRYPAFRTADRNITKDGDVHLTVPAMLWRLKNNGMSCNSCIRRITQMKLSVQRVYKILHELQTVNNSKKRIGCQKTKVKLYSQTFCKILPKLSCNHSIVIMQKGNEKKAQKWFIVALG